MILPIAKYKESSRKYVSLDMSWEEYKNTWIKFVDLCMQNGKYPKVQVKRMIVRAVAKGSLD